MIMKLNELREKLGINNPKALIKYRGIYTYRVGFFYTFGQTHQYHCDNLANRLSVAGINAVIIDSGEQWKVFRGGDTLKQGSHWWVKFRIIGEK